MPGFAYYKFINCNNRRLLKKVQMLGTTRTVAEAYWRYVGAKARRNESAVLALQRLEMRLPFGRNADEPLSTAWFFKIGEKVPAARRTGKARCAAYSGVRKQVL
jgi:hypothetical protein